MLQTLLTRPPVCVLAEINLPGFFTLPSVLFVIRA